MFVANPNNPSAVARVAKLEKWSTTALVLLVSKLAATSMFFGASLTTPQLLDRMPSWFMAVFWFASAVVLVTFLGACMARWDIQSGIRSGVICKVDSIVWETYRKKVNEYNLPINRGELFFYQAHMNEARRTWFMQWKTERARSAAATEAAFTRK